MTSLPRIRSSRANGALSRGPKTPEGKLRSAGNRCTHGFYSRRVVLKTESQVEFDELLQEFIDLHRPQSPAELAAVTQMVTAKWGIRRAWAEEARMMTEAILNFDPSIANPDLRAALAFCQLAEVPAFRNLPKFQAHYCRLYSTACKNLQAVRETCLDPKRKTFKNEDSDPQNDFFMSPPSIASSLEPNPPAGTSAPARTPQTQPTADPTSQKLKVRTDKTISLCSDGPACSPAADTLGPLPSAESRRSREMKSLCRLSPPQTQHL